MFIGGLRKRMEGLPEDMIAERAEQKAPGAGRGIRTY
jgi:hypothetical protein